MSSEILDVYYSNDTNPGLECEILTLGSLFGRKLDHSLENPQRLRFCMLLLITKGQGQHIVDFQPFSYQEGSLLFVAENQVQQYQVKTENDGLLIVFTKDFFYQNLQDREVLQSYRIFDFSLQSPALQLSQAEYPHFLALFQEIYHEYHAQPADTFKEELIRSLLRVILLRAERLKRSETLPTALSQYQDFSRFREQLERDFAHTRNVIDYAYILGFSAKKLNQLTKVTISKTAKEFIDDRVLLEIKRLLSHTDLSVKEIAARTGFDEPTNLVKFFKRSTGQTPLAFRAKLQ